MKVFQIVNQHKWHIIDPKDHNRSLCNINHNANPKVVATKEFTDERLCNICMSRGYKRGYLTVRSKS